METKNTLTVALRSQSLVYCRGLLAIELKTVDWSAPHISDHQAVDKGTIRPQYLTLPTYFSQMIRLEHVTMVPEQL